MRLWIWGLILTLIGVALFLMQFFSGNDSLIISSASGMVFGLGITLMFIKPFVRLLDCIFMSKT